MPMPTWLHLLQADLTVLRMDKCAIEKRVPTLEPVSAIAPTRTTATRSQSNACSNAVGPASLFGKASGPVWHQ